jgi:pimeloyl-ACP methyl ester carboxylesterase
MRPPLIIPALERLGRRVLRSRGAAIGSLRTSLGDVATYDVRCRGSLPPVGLLHGLGSNAIPFTPLIARLAGHVRRVVALDYPGHGFSPAPAAPVSYTSLAGAVVESLDALLPEPSIVVGNSLGGALALHYAIARPARVRALVLLSPAGARSTEAEWRELVRAFDARSRADALAFLHRVYHRVPLLAHLAAHELPAAALQRRAVREILAAATHEAAHDAAALSALTMPILLVWGRSERLLPAGHLAYYRAHLPRHTLFDEPAGLGHVPQGDNPAWVAERIAGFARGLRPYQQLQEDGVRT